MRNPGDGRVLPRGQPQQALDRARPQAGGGPRACCSGSPRAPTCCSTTTGPRRRAARHGVRDVSAVNPGLVYVGTYGFRASGPYGDKPAYDDIIQAASGLASLQASIVGEPRYVPTIVADKSSSMTVLAAVLAALYHKARTGEGQEVEVPMFESMAAWVMVEHLYGETFAPPVDTIGYKRILNPNRRPSRRGTATSRSSPTPTRTGATSSPSRAGRTCSTTRATRRSPRGSGTSRGCTRSWPRSPSPGRTPSGWPSWTGATSRR